MNINEKSYSLCTYCITERLDIFWVVVKVSIRERQREKERGRGIYGMRKKNNRTTVKPLLLQSIPLIEIISNICCKTLLYAANENTSYIFLIFQPRGKLFLNFKHYRSESKF